MRSLNNHRVVVFLDCSLLSSLCHKNSGERSARVQGLVRSLTGQEIRTDSTYVSGIVALEVLGITMEPLKKSHPEIFSDIPFQSRKISEIFKSEFDVTRNILKVFEPLKIQGIKERYKEYLKFQSPEGQYWLEHFLGPHVQKFSESHRDELVDTLAAEIVIGRNFIGFDKKELGMQFAVMYLTGVSGESALSSPRALEKVHEYLSEKSPDTQLADIGLTTRDFQRAQKYRNREEFLDTEMIQLVIFGHQSKASGSRPVVAITFENAASIEARLVSATGFLVQYRELHRRNFLPGKIYCVDRQSLDVVKEFNVASMLDRYE